MISTYIAGLLADTGVLLLGALSVYIILATGQLSLGNAGFAGIGAYLTSYLTVEIGFPITPALITAAFVCGAIGIVVGFPALRLKGIYLAMATLGFGEMVRSFFVNFQAMGGSAGFHGMKLVGVGYIWIWTAAILIVVMTLERSRLWAVHTPQVFRRELLERVLSEAPDELLAAATDEAWLIERAGGTVRVIDSPAENIKVTTAADLELAEVLLGR